MKFIPLKAKDGSLKAFALVDDDDYDHLNQWPWYYNEGYAVRNRPSEKGDGKQIKISMTRTIMKINDSSIHVDHENGNTIDNQKSNLRFANRNQNAHNRNKSQGKSKYRGVTWHKINKKWIAKSKLNNKEFYLGSFNSEIEAAEAASKFRAEHMPYSKDYRDKVLINES